MPVTVGNLGIIRLTGEDLTDLRRRVFFRDNYRCVRCGTRVTWNTGELAHREGRGRGGSDTDENTETCCHRCHGVNEHNPKSVRSKA